MFDQFLGTFALVASSALTASAVPIEAAPLASLQGRQGPCSPQNMPAGVSLYTCPNKQPANSDGTCTSYLPSEVDAPATMCSAYCEVRLTMNYGQEVPFSLGTCQQNQICTLTQGLSVAVTTGYSINTGISLGTKMKRDELDNSTVIANLEKRQEGGTAASLTAAFNLGASFEWSTTNTYTVSSAQTQQLGANVCGYWTFIPYLVESCGDLTATDTQAGTFDDEPPTCDLSTASTTGNWCNTTPAQDSNGHAIGESVLVLTTCDTHELYPMSYQNPAYGYPGVSTYQGPIA